MFSPHVVFCIFLPHYGNEEHADLTTEQLDELHFHGLSRLLVTLHCLFSFSVYLVKNCDNKKRLLLKDSPSKRIIDHDIIENPIEISDHFNNYFVNIGHSLLNNSDIHDLNPNGLLLTYLIQFLKLLY